MGLNIGEALRRAFTLPKSKNSLSDLVAPDVIALGKSLVKKSIVNGIDTAFASVTKIEATLHDEVIAAVRAEAGHFLPASVVEVISTSVDHIITDLAAATQVDHVRIAIETAILSALKL